MVATTILFALAGVFYALNKPNIYQASVLLAPTQDEGGVSGISGQLGGLASLAGINLGGGGDNQTVMAKAVLQSYAFLSDFIDRHELIIPLMATEAWMGRNKRGSSTVSSTTPTAANGLKMKKQKASSLPAGTW